MLKRPAMETESNSDKYFWSALEYAVHPALFLAFTPVVVNYFGKENYALWLIFLALVNVGSILSVGNSAAALRLIASRTSELSSRRVLDALRVAVASGVATGLTLATFTFLAIAFLSLEIFSQFPNNQWISLVALLAPMILVADQIDVAATAALKSHGAFRENALAEMLFRATQFVGGVAAAISTGCFGAVFVVHLFASVARPAAKLALFQSVSRTSLWSLLQLRGVLDDMGVFLRMAAWGWVIGAGGMLFNLADRFIIAMELGPEQLALYGMLSQIAMQIHAIPAAVLIVNFAQMSRRSESVDGRNHAIELRELLRVNLLFCGAIAFPLAAIGTQFFAYWVGGEYWENLDGEYYLLLLAYFLLGLNVSLHYYFLSLGKFKEVALANILPGIAAVCVIAVLIPHFHLFGVIVGRLVYSSLCLMLYGIFYIGLNKSLFVRKF